MSVNSNIYFHGIWGVTKSNMWVVGDGGNIDRVSIDKFNNGNSSQETSGVSVQLNGVSGSNSGDIWAVGNSGTIVHSFGDGTWTAQTNVAFSNMMTLYGVYALGPNDVYVVGTMMGGANKLVLHGQ